jgi:hypothetical protein
LQDRLFSTAAGKGGTMFHRALAIIVSLLISWHGLIALASAQEPKKEDNKNAPLSLSNMHLEVEALDTLHSLKATPEQMMEIQKLAKQTAQPSRKYKDPMVTDNYKQVLEDLHAALLLADDDDKIDSLFEQYDQLIQSEKPKFDDDYEVSEAASKAVPNILHQFKSGQIAELISNKAEEIGDPQDRLIGAMAQVRHATKDEWKSERDDAATQVGYLTAGLNSDKAKSIREQAVKLLDKARSLSDDDFGAQTQELTKQAKAIVGDTDPIDVLRHTVEYELARLLSNPRLVEVLKARLK